jgi:hypothetical protein
LLFRDRIGKKTIADFTVFKGFSPVLHHTLQAFDLSVGELERIAGGIIAVGFDLSPGFDIDDVLLQIIELGIGFAVIRRGQVIADGLSHDVQGCGGKLRTPLRTVPPDRPMIHQAEALIDILAGDDIRALKKYVAAGIDDLCGIRRQVIFHGDAAAQQDSHCNNKTKDCRPF